MITLLPPKKRAWKAGFSQIGIFIRTADGATLQMVNDRASPDETAFAYLLIHGLSRVPESLRRAVVEEWERVQREA